ncbi:MAG: aldo/keto reductase [Legionellales bacterium]|nr:aldo/keto reductase [Legionellales bacterium]
MFSSERPDNFEDSIGFGTNGISNKQVFEMAINEGYRLFDSADLYQNAALLSNAIQQSGIPRSEFFINYKILPNLGKEQFLLNTNEAIDKFGYIDVLMLHDVVVENEEDLIDILESLRPLLDSGAIKNIGLSNVDQVRLKSLIEKFPEIKFIQNQFSHVSSDNQVRNLCMEQGIQYMGYGIFGGRAEGSCTYIFKHDEPAWNISSLIYPELHNLANKYRTTPHAMLLTWAILQDTIQIPSSERKENMLANLNTKNIAEQMSKEDKDKLLAEFNLQVPAEEWIRLQELKAQGNRLARLKLYAGNVMSPRHRVRENVLSRHRLLEIVYRDDKLKSFYDVLFDYSDQSYDPKEYSPEIIAKYEEADRQLFVNIFTHFLEEALKVSETEFVSVISDLQEIYKNCTTDAEKTLLLDLVRGLGTQTPFNSRRAQLQKYISEQTFLKEEGAFQVEKLESAESLGQECITIGILGPNRKIYMLDQVPTNMSLKKVSELLVGKFPDDFRDVEPSFYISSSGETIEKDDLSSKTLLNLNMASGEFIEIETALKGVGNNLTGFFHHVDRDPKAFTATYNSPKSESQLKLENRDDKQHFKGL